MRYVASRPLLIAIGSAAVAELEREDADLQLVDAIAVDTPPDEHEIQTWLQRGFLDRSLTTCVVDLEDTAWHDSVTLVTRAARARSAIPIWLICMSRCLDRSERSARLHDLAARLGACVIDPGTGSPVEAALFAVAPLQRPGLVCCHTEDIAAVARAGAIGTFVAEIPATFPPDTTAAFVSIRFGDETSLAEIGGICERITNRLPEDGALLVAATPGPPCGVSAVLFTC